ncbi:MAG: hypothetical protein KIT42_12090 [Rhodocyclaceae bacterium]|nr:hypothetical protein [Rhodocyclaceae bacterium]
MDPNFFSVTLGGLVGSGLATAVFGLLVLRHSKTLEAQIKGHFDERIKIFESKRAWKQQALSELFGPLYMQLERTRRAFGRWNTKNIYLEAKVMRDGNEKARNLLLKKGHLIPSQLIEHAGALIEHYDAWLEEFDRVRGTNAPTSDEPFVFVGTKGHPFPSDAECAFKAEFKRLQAELYAA